MSKLSFKRVGIIGSGMVGQALGLGFIKHDCQVKIGTRDPARLAGWLEKVGSAGSTGSFAQAAGFGEVLVLACKGTVAEALVQELKPGLEGKLVLDACNPIAEAAPEQGVLRYFTGPDQSLMERLQQAAPGARFVKAFSCVGSAFMVDPPFAGGPPTMFICGDDEGAKAMARQILDAFGWQTEDMGGAPAARAIEPLAMLWCIPGLRENRWTHAFKLLKL